MHTSEKMCHGNSKQSTQFSKPYIRTNHLLQLKWTVYLKMSQMSKMSNESGSSIFSTSLSTEPQNMTQVLNRKIVKKRKLVQTSFAPPQSDPER